MKCISISLIYFFSVIELFFIYYDKGSKKENEFSIEKIIRENGVLICFYIYFE